MYDPPYKFNEGNFHYRMFGKQYYDVIETWWKKIFNFFLHLSFLFIFQQNVKNKINPEPQL